MKIFGHDNLRLSFILWEVACLVVSTAVLVSLHYGLSPRIAPVSTPEIYSYIYPHKSSQVLEDKMIIMIVFLSVLVTLPFMTALRYFKGWSWKNCLDDLIIFLSGFINGNVYNLLVTTVLKKIVGRPRPDFISRCIGSINPADINNYAAAHVSGTPIKNCVLPENDKIILDGRVSFPSGHSSGSVFSYVFIGMWMFERLGPYRSIGLVRLILPMYLFIFPLFVMASRVMDNRHNPADVIAGGLFGLCLSLLLFKFYYPLNAKPLVAPPAWTGELQTQTAAEKTTTAAESRITNADSRITNDEYSQV